MPELTTLADTARASNTMEIAIPAAQSLLAWLLDSRIMLVEEWDELPAGDRDRLSNTLTPDDLLAALVQRHLLTQFQVDAVKRGNGGDLVLGHYRLLDLLGRGGMGTVYRGEHLQLRREVAVKVMTRAADANPRLVHRFYAEARAVAKLQHPHIVTCFDAGRHLRPGAAAAPRDFFVMELIPGQDLFSLIREKGPLSPQRACELFKQVAEALAEAHRNGLIHRDIKPSNVLVTPDWQAKVLDFGLARMPTRNVTEPGTLLGTVGYMAPEQARDPSAIDSRADLWSLGATLYWALTGREPYPETGNPLHDLHKRMTTTPVPVRQLRPEVPQELSELVTRLMEAEPDARFQSARAVAAALTGFGLWMSVAPAPKTTDSPRRDRVLLVDDEPMARGLMATLLRDRYDIREAGDAESALVEFTRNPPDLAVVDVNLPGMSGPELVNKARSSGLGPDRMAVLLTSGMVPEEALGGLSLSGADDFLPKPFKPAAFVSRVRALLMRKAGVNVSAVEQSGVIGAGATVRIATAALTRAGAAAPQTIRTTRADRPAAAAESLSLTVSRLLIETNLAAEGQWGRVTKYVRALASAVPDSGEHARLKDDAFLDLLAAVAPVFDVGLLVVPRGLLMKPEKLDADEQSVVQTHTTVGSDVLQAVAGKLVAELPHLPLAAEVARGHHERWDGDGYPDQLAGTDIPLAARVVAIVAVYEALRVRRPHRPPQTHARAVKIITAESQGQFDPVLVAAFAAAAPRFEQIHLSG